MATKFKDFIREVEDETRAEGPLAVAELEAFRAHYALAQEGPLPSSLSAVPAQCDRCHT